MPHRPHRPARSPPTPDRSPRARARQWEARGGGGRHALEGGSPPPPSGRPAYAWPLPPRPQAPAPMAFVTDNNRAQPLWKPPPTAYLTAPGAAAEVPSLLKHPSARPPIHTFASIQTPPDAVRCAHGPCTTATTDNELWGRGGVLGHLRRRESGQPQQPAKAILTEGKGGR